MIAFPTESQIVVPVRRIDESDRANALPRHFGRYMLRVESAIFGWARNLSSQYRGGFWQFYEFGDGGFYMAPDSEPFSVLVAGNGFEGQLGSDAFGITCCLFAFSHLSFQISDETFAKHYQLLSRLATDHAEAGLIAGAID